jgi:hypothetical protein
MDPVVAMPADAPNPHRIGPAAGQRLMPGLVDAETRGPASGLQLTPAVLAEVLGHLPAAAVVQISLTVAELQEAMTMAAGGPEIMSPSQAAKVFGFSARRWRRWAEQGRVAGAAYEEAATGRRTWMLPREACRSWAHERLTAGHRPPQRPPPARPEPVPETPAFAGRTRRPPGRSVSRGPKKTTS